MYLFRFGIGPDLQEDLQESVVLEDPVPLLVRLPISSQLIALPQ
jgi:hypothetical protein